MEGFECLDCGIDTSTSHGIREYYMVQRRLWKLACESGTSIPDDFGENIGGMLCIGCLEKRLGRQLHEEDFLNCLLNSMPNLLRSERLINRLNTQPTGSVTN